jgi:hypothetical protein
MPTAKAFSFHFKRLRGSLVLSGIFARIGPETFGSLAPQNKEMGNWRPAASLQKPVCGPFSRSVETCPDSHTGWLTSQESNSHVPNRKNTFEMSREFLLVCQCRRVGDFYEYPRQINEARDSDDLVRFAFKNRRPPRQSRGRLGATTRSDQPASWARDPEHPARPVSVSLSA